MKTIKSKQGTLQGRDFSRGTIVGALSLAFYAVMEAVLAALSAGGIESLVERETLLRIGTVALSSILGYLTLNFGQRSKVGVIQAEGKEAREIIAAKNEGNPPPMGDPTHPKKPTNP